MYVVVNMTIRHPSLSSGGHLVMPGENPHTYISLDEAVEQQVDLHYEHGHMPETAVIYKLTPVPLEEITPLFEATKEEMREDYT